MDQRNYTGRLKCKQCRLTFRQQVPPKDHYSYERVTCSDCGHYIDTWDENGVAVTSKGPHPDRIKYASNWQLHEAEMFADVVLDSFDDEEYFRPAGQKS